MEPAETLTYFDLWTINAANDHFLFRQYDSKAELRDFLKLSKQFIKALGFRVCQARPDDATVYHLQFKYPCTYSAKGEEEWVTAYSSSEKSSVYATLYDVCSFLTFESWYQKTSVGDYLDEFLRKNAYALKTHLGSVKDKKMFLGKITNFETPGGRT